MTDKQDSIVVDGVEWFVDDTVKIVRTVERRHPTGHCGKEWENAWVSDMTETVGSTSYIKKFCGAEGIRLTNDVYSYPSSSLQNISAEQREAKKKAKEQMDTKKDSIMLNGVEWHIGDRVVWVHGSGNVYSISEFRGDNIVLFEGYTHEYTVPTKVFVNASAIGREHEKEVAPAPAPTLGGIELKPWMRVETCSGKGVVCHNICTEGYAEYVLCYGQRVGFDYISPSDALPEFLAVYAAPDYPTLHPDEHGTLLWSKAGEEAKKEAEAKKKEAMTALEAAEVEFEAAKERYNEAYAKLVAITD